MNIGKYTHEICEIFSRQVKIEKYCEGENAMLIL